MGEFLVTLDVDWAPEFVLEDVISLLDAHGVRATWFVTHRSELLDRVGREDACELGIHPNFLPGSTHGRTEREVLSHMFELVPGAVSMRSHAVVQSGPLFHLLATETPIRIDSSVFLPGHPSLRPVAHFIAGHPLFRLPFFWADDHELGRGGRANWDLEGMIQVAGVKVMMFHPVHVYLNSTDWRRYAELKTEVPRLSGAGPAALEPFRSSGPGVRTFFLSLLEHLKLKGETRTMKQLVPEAEASIGRETGIRPGNPPAGKPHRDV